MRIEIKVETHFLKLMLIILLLLSLICFSYSFLNLFTPKFRNFNPLMVKKKNKKEILDAEIQGMSNSDKEAEFQNELNAMLAEARENNAAKGIDVFSTDFLKRAASELQTLSDYENNNNRSNNNSNSVMQAKLQEEISSPFRKVRQFIYIAFGLGGGIGLFTALPQLSMAFSTEDADITNAIINVFVDLGGLLGAFFLWRVEGAAGDEKVEVFIEKTKGEGFKMDKSESNEREVEISSMPVEINFSESNAEEKRIVRFGDLQTKGNQHLIVIAGNEEVVKDAVLSARIEGSDLFSMKDTMVVPVVFDGVSYDDSPESGPKQLAKREAEVVAKGFGAKKSILDAPYIGQPTQLNVWRRYLTKEVDQAKAQGTPDILEQGLVLAVRRDGKISRRGVGIPPWKSLIEELEVSFSG